MEANNDFMDYFTDESIITATAYKPIDNRAFDQRSIQQNQPSIYQTAFQQPIQYNKEPTAAPNSYSAQMTVQHCRTCRCAAVDSQIAR